MITKFKTQNLLIRPISENDVDFAFEYWTQDINIAKYMTWKPHQSKEETKKFIASCIEGWSNNNYTWIIEDKNTKNILGNFTARRSAYKIDIGYLLLTKYWGKGYMTEVIREFIKEAFKIKDVHRIWGVCDIENIASKRVMEKSGMQYEGLLRSWLVHPNMGDEPRDCHCLSIVRQKA